MSEPRDDAGPHPPAPETDPVPVVACPACGREQHDLDGFGFLYCPPPLGCGRCTHPHRAGGACGLCGEVCR